MMKNDVSEMKNKGAERKLDIMKLIRRFLVFCREQPLGALGMFLLAFLILIAIFAPIIAGVNPTYTNITKVLWPPSSEFRIGTDYLGRDMWSRWMYSAQISLTVSMLAVSIATVVGGTIGVWSGFVGGRWDSIIQRLADILMAMPGLVKAIIFMAVFGTSIPNLILAIAINFTPRLNRITRGVAISVKESLFVESARVAGASTLRITLRHVAPNCVAPLLVYSSALLGQAFLAEASLSFLGLGVPPPAPSWGRDLSENVGRLGLAPWLAIFPGVGISLAVFGANFLGDALRNMLDPRLKRI